MSSKLGLRMGLSGYCRYVYNYKELVKKNWAEEGIFVSIRLIMLPIYYVIRTNCFVFEKSTGWLHIYYTKGYL